MSETTTLLMLPQVTPDFAIIGKAKAADVEDVKAIEMQRQRAMMMAALDDELLDVTTDERKQKPVESRKEESKRYLRESHETDFKFHNMTPKVI